MANHPDMLVASDYVVCATVHKIPDIFNVELLWERVRGAQDGVFLLEALKRYPRTVRPGRTYYYSQVVVRIPERDYIRDDRLEDGLGRRTLIRDLQHLHEQAFGSALVEDAVIRYRVEADSTLRAGEAQFLFGRAIHVPPDAQSPIFSIEAALEGREDWRDLGPIYPSQRLTLLNGDRRTSSFPVLVWPFASAESVLLVQRSAPQSGVDVLAEPPHCLTLSADGEGGFLARDRRNRGLHLRITAPKLSATPFARAATTPPRNATASFQHSARPLGTAPPTPAMPEAVEPSLSSLDAGDYPQIDHWGRREPVFSASLDLDAAVLDEPHARMSATQLSIAPAAKARDAVLLDRSAFEPSLDTHIPQPLATEVDQGTWVPRRPAPCVKIMGIALQRLSTYAAVGIRDWRLSFDETGHVLLDADQNAVLWLRIDSADHVFGDTSEQSLLLEIPSVWRPTAELALQLHVVPAPMSGHYLGWMRLPAPLIVPAPRGRAVSFGRGSEADIAPKLLADPRALRWQGGSAQTAGISAEYLGLSRRHLSFQARQGDWWVQLESQNMPAYRLSAQGEWLDTLTPGINTSAGVKADELLVAGAYVLALGALE